MKYTRMNLTKLSSTTHQLGWTWISPKQQIPTQSLISWIYYEIYRQLALILYIVIEGKGSEKLVAIFEAYLVEFSVINLK
ncbi:hypothetical protein Phum_PHUM122560 [Pediculus humanus corporis]|uniref:Uncharacterized protein n=1 Tax=Pediculus humanus subsp. corporis TaxID=121224 RepID=E0VDP8_PEDHC|nr:uncharacterized protein Phum_PHUM122560 [Pediculus humanus corporis]EEB11504.1 hypothetical protein Phum_PHUM122560 [Pediculus humanus corporis]